MECKNPEQTIRQALQILTFPREQELMQKFQVTLAFEDVTGEKNKLKKNLYLVEENDSANQALNKLNKLMQKKLIKPYQSSGKTYIQAKKRYSQVEKAETRKQQANKKKSMYEDLSNRFKKNQDGELKNEEHIEKEEETKRKQLIQMLQERVKTIQVQYEETRKIKVQKLRENQTLKNQLKKLESRLFSSESLGQEELKKKQMEIQTQKDTIRQKIEMMQSLKNKKMDTEQKIKKSKEIQEKISNKLKKLQDREQELLKGLAKAHIVFEEYKKAFNVLKLDLLQKQKELFAAKQYENREKNQLQNQKKKIECLEKEYQTQTDQLHKLKEQQRQLEKQLLQ